jgi:hypothetical protein
MAGCVVIGEQGGDGCEALVEWRPDVFEFDQETEAAKALIPRWICNLFSQQTAII